MPRSLFLQNSSAFSEDQLNKNGDFQIFRNIFPPISFETNANTVWSPKCQPELYEPVSVSLFAYYLVKRILDQVGTEKLPKWVFWSKLTFLFHFNEEKINFQRNPGHTHISSSSFDQQPPKADHSMMTGTVFFPKYCHVCFFPMLSLLNLTKLSIVVWIRISTHISNICNWYCRQYKNNDSMQGDTYLLDSI